MPVESVYSWLQSEINGRIEWSGIIAAVLGGMCSHAFLFCSCSCHFKMEFWVLKITCFPRSNHMGEYVSNTENPQLLSVERPYWHSKESR